MSKKCLFFSQASKKTDSHLPGKEVLSVQLPWWWDLKQHAMGKPGAFGNPQINCPVYVQYIPAENATKPTCREPLKATAERIRVQGTSPHYGNPSYLGNVEVWGFRPAAITSRLSIASGSFPVNQSSGSQTADSSVRAASDTEAQLKPLKQNKSCLCQACTLHNTAEMTATEESAYAAGIYLKNMTNHIL